MATDKERIYLIAEAYINVKGKATSKELRDFIHNGTFKFHYPPTSQEIAGALKGHRRFGHQKINGQNHYHMEE